ncbi:MAG: patatin-like phospholipase family protein [Acidimicrobiales bacterium]
MATIGLVLAAGGSVGVAYHGGVLAALEEATGWDPRAADLIVGTSAGSVTAALLRAGLSAPDLACVSENRPLSAAGEILRTAGSPHRPRPPVGAFLRPRGMADPAAVLSALARPWSRSAAALLAAVLPAGTVSTDAITAGFDATFAGRWPEAPTWISAVRLRDGKRVVFGAEGAPFASVGQAVGASCAIPGYFSPVRIGGDRYVDGGVRSMANLDLLVGPNVGSAGRGLDLVLVSSPMSHAGARPTLALDVGLRHLWARQLSREVIRVRRRGIEVVVVAPDRDVLAAMGPNPMDARRRSAVSRAARAGVMAFLDRSDEGRALAQLLRPEAGGRGAAGPAPTSRSG